MPAYRTPCNGRGSSRRGMRWDDQPDSRSSQPWVLATMLQYAHPLLPLHTVHAPKSSNLLRHPWAGLSPNDQRRPLLGFAACACLPNPPHLCRHHAISQASQARDGLASNLERPTTSYQGVCTCCKVQVYTRRLGLVQLRGSGCIQEALGGSACMQDPYFPSPVALVVCDR